MGFYPPDALVHEARRRGVRLTPADANRSRVLCHVESPREAELRGGLAVRIGLGYVKGVREEEMESLVRERERGGPYRDIADLASRSGTRRDSLERLAWAGALDDMAAERREALWATGIAGTGVRHQEGTQMALPLPTPDAPPLAPLGEWERAIADYRSTGMTLGPHPMALMRDGLGAEVLRSTDLEGTADGDSVQVAGMVVARQRPETAKGIVFMLIEDERGAVNLIVPPPVYDRFRAIVRSAPLVAARGRLERREGTINVVVSELRELERVETPSSPESPSTPPDLSRGRDRRRQQHELRRRAVAELRAVAPGGHSFGRRGR
jgi:error-prone DNA polymerase